MEGHGTGTALGDPIEAQALLATYGQGRRWVAVVVGVGEVEYGSYAGGGGGGWGDQDGGGDAAWGDAADVDVDAPSRHVDWSVGGVELLTESREWVRGGPRRAGVSSFGISGTNAHVIVEEAPAEPVFAAGECWAATDSGGVGLAVVPWVVSGNRVQALAGQAGRLLAWAAFRRSCRWWLWGVRWRGVRCLSSGGGGGGCSGAGVGGVVGVGSG